MLTYIVRRLLTALLLLSIVSLVVFAIFFMLPRLVGQTPDQMAYRYVGRNATPAVIQSTVERLHLDDPITVQYGRFVKRIFVGEQVDLGPRTVECPPPCFGYSFNNDQPVWPQIKDRIPVTASLALGASIIWLLVGVATGVLSALRRGSAFDRMAMGVALAGVSLPIYFTGLLALQLFSYKWGLFPGGGTYTAFFDNPAAWAYALVLPWITLAFLYAALYARLTRAGMLETMSEDYIRTARAKGLSEPVVITKHALRASLTPILTIFGLDLGLLLGGAVLTETVFSLPGLGKFFIDAVTGNDLPVVLGVTMFAALFVVIANLVVDLLYGVIDPRVRT